MACDDLVSPKHDQAISGAACVRPSSDGNLLSICGALAPKRSDASCICSLINSLLSLFLSSLLQSKTFPKTPRFLSLLAKRKTKHTKVVLFKRETWTSGLQQLSCPQRHPKTTEMTEITKRKQTPGYCLSVGRQHTGGRWAFSKKKVLCVCCFV